MNQEQQDGVGKELEVNLVILLYWLWRNKSVVIVFFLAAVIISFSASHFFMEREYEATTMIRMANLGPDLYTETENARQLLHSPVFLRESLIERGVDEELIRRLIRRNGENLNVEKADGERFLLLSVYDRQPERAQMVANTLAKSFVERSNEGAREHLSLLHEKKERTQDILANHDSFGEEIREFRTLFEEIDSEERIFELSYIQTSLMSIKESVERNYSVLLDDYYEVRKQIAATEGAVVFNEASLPESPSFPNVKLNMIVGGFLGLILGVFSVLVLELIRGFKLNSYEAEL